MILAGDIGGTNTRLALFRTDAGHLHLQHEQIYSSRKHAGLAEIIQLFRKDSHDAIHQAAFGIAGPVLHGRVSASNLPWVIEEASLASECGLDKVFLINDLEAHASGVDDLEPSDFISLNSPAGAEGNAALIAAGTGLGEAGLYDDGNRRHAFPCEGGHSDFAPRNQLEIGLLQYLLNKFERVSYERILSGPGLKNVYDFLRDSGTEEEPPWLRDELSQASDATATISQHGMSGTAAICVRALDVFVTIYGAEAGNLALKLMATGGVFVSGGIASHILSKLTGPEFLQAFVAKGRLQPVLEKIPVKVITNDRVGLIGAARYALNRQARPSATR